MSRPKYPAKANPDNKLRREAFERNSEQVISGLADAEARTSREFGEALAAINASLFAMAYSFLRGEPNLARRRDLAEEARQIWHEKMLAVGFKSYLTEGKPLGWPFGRYAIAALFHICVSLLRGRDRVCTLASLDGFSDPRRDPRDAAERRELELDCRELMEKLPPKWQEMLRSIYWHRRSNLETSDRLQTNPNTVATWHARSRKRLGGEFRKRGYWPP
jgi:RNA polymerase sigma factor (sigma-70 family)